MPRSLSRFLSTGLLLASISLPLSALAQASDPMIALDQSSLPDRFSEDLAEIASARRMALAGELSAAARALGPSARAGNAAALNLLGVLQTDLSAQGGGLYDPVAGVAALKEAADAGFPPAFHNLGLFYSETHAQSAPDLAAAARAFEAAVAMGYRPARLELAQRLANGTGTAIDFARARALATAAARDESSGAAEVLLGDLAFFETDRAADIALALRHYEASAAKGNGHGAHEAALIYYYGETGAVDLNAARAFFAQALAGGEERARAFLIRVHANVGNPARALALGVEAAALGDVAGQTALWEVQAYGIGKAPDFNAARALAQSLRDKGAAEGSYLLGEMAYDGLGAPVDHIKALGLYREAVARDPAHEAALFSLGFMLMRGQGDARDYPAASRFLLRAHGAGSGDAVYDLALLHGHGDFAGPHQEPLRALWACLTLEGQGADLAGEGLERERATCVTALETASSDDRAAAAALP
ncbi:MAG: tetratricopeptide repeat protein [Pseudomonadota bacterium]